MYNFLNQKKLIDTSLSRRHCLMKQSYILYDVPVKKTQLDVSVHHILEVENEDKYLSLMKLN